MQATLLHMVRRRSSRLVIVFSLLAIWGIGLAFLLWSLKGTDTAWEHIQESGTLRVGVDASYPPFETIDQSTGQPVGYDVDLAIEMGKRLGVKVTFTNIAYDGLYDSLATGNVDVLVSAMADLPQFEGKAAFSLPYFNAGEMLITRQEAPFAAMEDLANHTVGVEYGSGGDVEARKWQRRIANLEVKRYPDPESALNAVRNGEVDAVIVDGIAGRLAVGQGKGLIGGPHLVDTLFAAAVASDNDILLEKVNETVKALAADGTLSRLADKWFGPESSSP